MLVHLLITDSTQHKYGPQSPAAYTAVALADAQVAEVLRALDAAGIRERTTLFVTADHGFETALKIVTEVTLAAGNQGHHGYLATNPKMNASFIAWGRGIKRGAKLGLINNVDVAPTMARLLDQAWPGADGRVLTELLDGAAVRRCIGPGISGESFALEDSPPPLSVVRAVREVDVLPRFRASQVNFPAF